VHIFGFIARNLSRCTVTWTSEEINLLFPVQNKITVQH